MARKKSANLTDAELRLMDVIWEKGEATVSDVADALPRELELARADGVFDWRDGELVQVRQRVEVPLLYGILHFRVIVQDGVQHGVQPLPSAKAPAAATAYPRSRNCWRHCSSARPPGPSRSPSPHP